MSFLEHNFVITLNVWYVFNSHGYNDKHEHLCGPPSLHLACKSHYFYILACKPRCKGEKYYFIDINNYTTNIQQKI